MMMSEDDDYWGKAHSFTIKLENLDLPMGEKFMMHTLYAVQGKVKAARKNKPFQEWTFEDMLNSVVGTGERS